MRPDNPSRRPATTPLASRIGRDSTAADIAAAGGALWLELAAVLTPIIGPRGVMALGERSLHLASSKHPWLAARQPGGPTTLDAALLVSLLAQRSSDEAAAAAHTLFPPRHELLSSLIGASLTERLLRTVWGPPDTPWNSATDQDPSP